MFSKTTPREDSQATRDRLQPDGSLDLASATRRLATWSNHDEVAFIEGNSESTRVYRMLESYLLAEATGLPVHHEAQQPHVRLADAIALVVALLQGKIMTTTFHLKGNPRTPRPQAVSRRRARKLNFSTE